MTRRIGKNGPRTRSARYPKTRLVTPVGGVESRVRRYQGHDGERCRMKKKHQETSIHTLKVFVIQVPQEERVVSLSGVDVDDRSSEGPERMQTGTRRMGDPTRWNIRVMMRGLRWLL